MRENILEVEVDTPTDNHLFFGPIGRAIRGRLDLMRVARRDPDAIRLTTEFPEGVPGQRIVIDLASGACSIRDPLHDAEWTGCREALEKRDFTIPPTMESFNGARKADWLWAVSRALRDGYCRIVRGSLPADLGIETERVSPPDPGEDRIDRLCDLVERLLERLVPASA